MLYLKLYVNKQIFAFTKKLWFQIPLKYRADISKLIETISKTPPIFYVNFNKFSLLYFELIIRALHCTRTCTVWFQLFYSTPVNVMHHIKNLFWWFNLSPDWKNRWTISIWIYPINLKISTAKSYDLWILTKELKLILICN